MIDGFGDRRRRGLRHLRITIKAASTPAGPDHYPAGVTSSTTRQSTVNTRA
jgi:hypothetical protein